MHQHMLGTSQLESIFVEKDLRVVVNTKSNMSQQCAQKMCRYGTLGHSLAGMVVLGWWLDLMILKGFSNLYDSKEGKTRSLCTRGQEAAGSSVHTQLPQGSKEIPAVS